MRLLVWLLRALIFITLFAFASNNQHEVRVYGPFGLQWQGRMIFVVLAAFAFGTIVGALAMLPWRWRQQPARPVQESNDGAAANAADPARAPDVEPMGLSATSSTQTRASGVPAAASPHANAHTEAGRTSAVRSATFAAERPGDAALSEGSDPQQAAAIAAARST